MDAALIASAGLIGLLGAPHCTAMCGAPCSALARRCGGDNAAWAGFLGGRLVGYVAAGALVAGGVALLKTLGGLAPALRPLWAALHLVALGIGVWMLCTGALPAWFERLGAPARSAPAPASAGGWQSMAGPLQAAGAGSLWVGLPCGLLQSALVVAALASTPLHGAAAMAAFAATSSLGLAVLPLAWARGVEVGTLRWAVRASGALLIAGSGWALGHGLWQRVAAYCGLG